MLKLEDIKGFTQEEFEKAYKDDVANDTSWLNDRVARAKESQANEDAKKYEGYLSPEQVAEKYNGYISKEEHDNAVKDYEEKLSKYTDIDKQLSSKDEEINSLKLNTLKVKVALDNGLPYALANKLTGKDEKELTEDAKTMAQFMMPKATSSPRRNPEAKGEEDGVLAAFKKLNPNIKI